MCCILKWTSVYVNHSLIVQRRTDSYKATYLYAASSNERQCVLQVSQTRQIEHLKSTTRIKPEQSKLKFISLVRHFLKNVFLIVCINYFFYEQHAFVCQRRTYYNYYFLFNIRRIKFKVDLLELFCLMIFCANWRWWTGGQTHNS